MEHQATARPQKRDERLSLVIRAGWLALFLGLGVSSAALLVKAAFGGRLSAEQLLVDAVGTSVWSVLVVVGLALGAAVEKSRRRVMGFCGMFVAPFALVVVQIAQSSVPGESGLPAETFNPALAVMAGVRALEYFALGFLVGGLAAKPHVALRHYVLMGARVGIIAAFVVWRLTVDLALAGGSVLSLAQSAELVTKELLFPIGCAMILGFLTHVRWSNGAPHYVGSAALD